MYRRERRKTPTLQFGEALAGVNDHLPNNWELNVRKI